MIILYVVPISLWPMLGKENRYFYTRHSNNDDRWLYPTFASVELIAFKIKYSDYIIMSFLIQL